MEHPDRDEPDDRAHGEGDDDGLDEAGFRTPLPPDDRLWRHPSELDLPMRLREPMRRRGPGVGRVVTSWSTAAVAGLLGAVLAIGVVASTGMLRDEPPIRETVVREMVAPAFAPSSRAGQDSDEAVVRIAADAGPAVVRIEVLGDQDGSGSGVLFRDDGHVLTNAHVVDEADRIMVVLSDGSSFDAELVGSDGITDIAVVKVSRTAPFPSAVIGTAANLAVGQPTIAIGSPLGLIGGSSVTTGVVSALGREVDSREGPPLLDMIQTDAAIAPGSSGGALLDMNGTVIGITTAIAVSQVGAEGLGFAVPIDLATRVGAQIISGGKAVHVWLGIEGRDLDAARAADAGLKGGAEVTDVVRRSPAADAQVAKGDVIVALDGQQVRSMAGLVIALRSRSPGDVIVLTVIRDGQAVDLEAALE
ncbi:MAG: trypsin-like peptidase domain-containing protein, partial [Acidimicrobiales bacterium]